MQSSRAVAIRARGASRAGAAFMLCLIVAIVLRWVCPESTARGAVITIEPDDYAEGTVLTTASPAVTFTVLDQNDAPLPTSVIPVTAATDDMGFAPTGTKVFAHSNIPFFIDSRRLRMDFTQPVSSLSLGFAGGTYFDTDFGQLEAYSAAGTLLATSLTAGMGPGQKTTLGLSRASDDISYAIAWSVPGDGPYGPFGRFDALTFDTAVPEPAGVAALLLTTVAIVGTCSRRRA